MARILLIEDDALVRETLMAQLAGAGHEVVPAAHGGEGLKEFERTSFDLVVTDILMPTVEGLETIKRLRELDSSVAIIAMSGGARSLMADSGNPRIDVLRFANAFGATRTLHKPFSRAELLAAVDDCLRTATAGSRD
jgi:DNA-binding response OmpR family regulator